MYAYNVFKCNVYNRIKNNAFDQGNYNQERRESRYSANEAVVLQT